MASFTGALRHPGLIGVHCLKYMAGCTAHVTWEMSAVRARCPNCRCADLFSRCMIFFER